MKKRARTFGWCQDASDFDNLKKAVSIFDSNSSLNRELREEKIPRKVTDKDLAKSFIDILSKGKIEIEYLDLVGTASAKKENSKCNSILLAAIEGQKRDFISNWAADNFVRWMHLLNFIDYNEEYDSFKITSEGQKYVNSKTGSEEEKEILISALLSYPPACRILCLLSEGGVLTKYELGSQLGFVGESGFTTLPQNILVDCLANVKDKKEKNKIRSDWDGSSDKYARQICSWLEKLGLVKKTPKNIEYLGHEETIGHAYQITSDGLKCFRRITGINKVKRTKKNVFLEMLCTKGPDRDYIRFRRAKILEVLMKSTKAVDLNKIRDKLYECDIKDSELTIRKDIKGLINLGLNIIEQKDGYMLKDEIVGLHIPENVDKENLDYSELKEFCLITLQSIGDKYISLIDISHDNKNSRLFEIEILNLLIEQLDFKGHHLGGSRKPDVIVYNEELNIGIIIDTKAYSKGFSLPICEADKMKRYINENIERSEKINPNCWWTKFPKSIDRFIFLFVSSKYSGNVEDRLENIYVSTGVSGSCIDIVNLLILVNKYNKGNLTMDDIVYLLSRNKEVVFE